MQKFPTRLDMHYLTPEGCPSKVPSTPPRRYRPSHPDDEDPRLPNPDPASTDEPIHLT